MLIHATCCHPLKLNLTAMGWNLTSEFCVTLEGISPSVISVDAPKSNSGPKFFCDNCNSTVEESKISVQCSYCGGSFPIDKIYKVGDLWGEWCWSCASKKGYNLFQLTSIKTIFNK